MIQLSVSTAGLLDVHLTYDTRRRNPRHSLINNWNETETELR